MGSTSLLPHGSVASTLESSPYSEYACGSSRLAPRPAAKLKRSLKNRIKWPELRFPPINLWVMASLPGSKPSKVFHLDMATHTRQRPGFSAKRPNALNSHVNGRTQDGCADQNTLICEKRGNRNFRAARSRKAMDTLSTVRTNIHRRLESLLAVRGGKL